MRNAAMFAALRVITLGEIQVVKALVDPKSADLYVTA